MEIEPLLLKEGEGSVSDKDKEKEMSGSARRSYLGIGVTKWDKLGSVSRRRSRVARARNNLSENLSEIPHSEAIFKNSGWHPLITLSY